MESPSLKEENIINGVNLTTIKDIRNLFRLEQNEEIKDRILRDMRNVFRLEKVNKVIKDILFKDNRMKKKNIINQ